MCTCSCEDQLWALGWHFAPLQWQRPGWLSVQVLGPSGVQGTEKNSGVRDLQGVRGGYPGHSFLLWRKLLGSSTEQGAVNSCCSHCMADIGSRSPSSLFQALSAHLHSASFWVEWNRSGSFMRCPERLGKLLAHRILHFLAKGNPILAISSAGLEDRMRWANEAPSFPLCTVILSFCSIVLLKFLRWTSEPFFTTGLFVHA